MPRPVPVRGVIEGFYGPPWTHEARTHVIEFLGARGMNAYVYAPKDDPKHRGRWREPYDQAELLEFADLVACCERAQARLGFAISPGLDIDHESTEDRAALLAKLLPMLDAGVTWFVLAVDDIPNRAGLADEHVALTTWLIDAVASRHADVRWSLVPTEYVGTRPSEYLETLSTGLPPHVDVCWTGPTVCSPTISAGDARAWRDAVGGRPLLLWDNYPVNDAVMERELHLGPYRGRDADVTDVVDGVLCNPMLQARASLVALATAAEFLADPTGYREDDAWERAIVAVGGESADALRAMAHACSDGPLAEARELPAHRLLDALAQAPTAAAPLAALRTELQALRDAAETWSGDEALGAELAPWREQARREADAGLAALRLLELLGEAAAEAERLMIHSFALLFMWSAARDAPPRIVLGPRFALHPAVVQRPDGSPALDVGLAVREDQSVVDRLARLALATYAERDVVISIVMPAHNEAELLADSVTDVVEGLRDRGTEFEVLVVENGSADGTLALADDLRVRFDELRVDTLPKADYGAALRRGLLTARGEAVVNFDVDYYDLDFLRDAVELMRADQDPPAIVVGSKRAPGADDQRSGPRRFVTWAFSFLLRLLFGLQVSDTHGMKAMRRDAVVPLANQCRFDADLFDTELVIRAERADLTVTEIPVHVSERRPSRTSIIGRATRSLWGLARLRVVLWRDRATG